MLWRKNIIAHDVEEYISLVEKELDRLVEEKPWMFEVDLEIDEFPADMLEISKSSEENIEAIEDYAYELLWENDASYEQMKSILEISVDVGCDVVEDFFESMEFFEVARELSGDYIRENIKPIFDLELDINLYPYQEDNLDSEGSLLDEGICAFKQFAGIANYSFFEDYSKDDLLYIIREQEVLNVLFASQGYSFEDILDDDKVSESEFLRSFYEEMANFYDGCTSLVFSLRTSVGDYLKYFTNKNYKVLIEPNKDLVVGIFDPVRGSSSILEVELEKAIELDCERIEFQVEERRRNYGYTIGDVLGGFWDLSKEYEFIEK